MERLWVTVAAFSGEKRSGEFNYPYRNSLLQTAAAQQVRNPSGAALALPPVFGF